MYLASGVRMRALLPLLPLLCLAAAPPGAQDVSAFVNGELPGLVEIYKDIHAHPELSHHEERTSALLAGELRKAGYAVTERVGRYPDGSRGYGVVAILKNGDGPTVLIRTDLDALPVVEETGLPYASTVKAKNAAGQEVGVMHACGHDIHIATMIGVARALAAEKARWHGTAMLIGQPSEETADGAKAMLADGLYERFGRPQMAIALHDTNTEAAGTVAVTSGAAQAGTTSVDVTIRGVGGHGAEPQDAKDPIVMAAEFIVQLQTVVSRQENPFDPAVVTVGHIEGGTKRNIIPNEVKLELTTRYFSDRARQVILDGIRNTARGVAVANGVPDDLSPIVVVVDRESAPVNYNDPALTARVRAALALALGANNVIDEPPIMPSEDFGSYGLEGHAIPTMMFWLGAIDPEKFAAAKAAGTLAAGPHNSHFAPLPEATLRTGVLGMTSAAMALLRR
jgi:hippurate hydrolase